MSDIRQETFYPHPPERVWRALTDADAIAAWLMPNDFKAQLGARFQFRTKPAPGFDGVVNCVVLTLDEPRKVSYSWRGGGMDTVVTWTLEPRDGGTMLRLDHTGFAGIKGYLVRSILAKGWGKMAAGSFVAVLDRLAIGLPANSVASCSGTEVGTT